MGQAARKFWKKLKGVWRFLHPAFNRLCTGNGIKGGITFHGCKALTIELQKPRRRGALGKQLANPPFIRPNCTAYFEGHGLAKFIPNLHPLFLSPIFTLIIAQSSVIGKGDFIIVAIDFRESPSQYAKNREKKPHHKP